MRFSARIRPLVLPILAFGLLATAPAALASSGLSISLENLFVPLGKQVERQNPDPSASPGTRQIGPGRETTEWIGLSGFFDLNRNWRVLYGAHTTLLGSPLFKLDGSLAFMLEMPANVPLQPYFYLGATPVISTRTDLPPLGVTVHSGFGVDFIWNNKLFTHVRLNVYMLSLYGEESSTATGSTNTTNINDRLNLRWNPASFSLSAGMGYLF